MRAHTHTHIISKTLSPGNQITHQLILNSTDFILTDQHTRGKWLIHGNNTARTTSHKACNSTAQCYQKAWARNCFWCWCLTPNKIQLSIILQHNVVIVSRNSPCIYFPEMYFLMFVVEIQWKLFERKYQSSTSLEFVRGIYQWPWFPHTGPVMRKMFPFDDVINASISY